MKKTILITGASSGIGYHTAKAMAASGHRLILAARQTEKIQRLAEELHQQYQTETHLLTLDVRHRDDVFQLLGNLPEAWKKIDVLVNNAGLASGLDPFHQGDLEDWENMIDTNIKGLLYVSKVILEGMVQRKSGQIINIGSVAGLDAYPMGNVYCSSKSFVEMLSKNLRIDLVEHGIRVSVVHPGAVTTGFSLRRFHGDEERAKNVYNGFTPLTGEDVADVIKFIVDAPPHVNLASITLLPSAQASGSYIYRKS